jgi:hypothetical protein
MEVLKKRFIELRGDLEVSRSARGQLPQKTGGDPGPHEVEDEDDFGVQQTLAPISPQAKFEFDALPRGAAFIEKTREKAARMDALQHENEFLRNQIREMSELVERRDIEMAELQRCARLRTWELKEEARHLAARVEELEEMQSDSAQTAAALQALRQELQQQDESARAARDALELSSSAHLRMQGALFQAAQRLEATRAALQQREAQVRGLGEEIARLALQQADSTAVLKSKEAAFTQAQLRRVQARMQEQEQELRVAAAMHSAAQVALHTHASGAEEKERLLAASLATNAQLEAVFREQLAAKDVIILSLQASYSAGSHPGQSTSALAPAPDEQQEPKRRRPLAQPLPPAPHPIQHQQAPQQQAQHQQKAPQARLGGQQQCPQCPQCLEAAYGLMSICRGCAASYHALCFEGPGAAPECMQCGYRKAGRVGTAASAERGSDVEGE